jgi:hypothetical protein
MDKSESPEVLSPAPEQAQEVALEESPEAKQENFERKKEAAVERAVGQGEEKIQKVLNIDFKSPELGYTDQERAEAEKTKESFKSFVEKSGDDPEKMLDLLAKEGIAVVKDSKYLNERKKSHGNPLAELARELNKEPTGVGAQFGTAEHLREIASSGKFGEVATKELLEATKDSKGAIFLGKEPVPKSMFHESCHALQYLNGQNMDASNNEVRAKRELEVNYIMMATKEEDGLLKSIDRLKADDVRTRMLGEHKIPSVVFGANDIVYEARRAEANIADLKTALAEKKDKTGLEDARSELDKKFGGDAEVKSEGKNQGLSMD